MSPREHLIVVTHGREDGGTAALTAASLAVSMQAMDIQVSMFVTMGGTRWAYSGTGEHVVGSADISLEMYLQSFLKNDGEMLVCSACCESFCALPGVGDDALRAHLREGVTMAGLATVAQRLLRMKCTVF